MVCGRWTWHIRIANHAATFQGSNKGKKETLLKGQNNQKEKEVNHKQKKQRERGEKGIHDIIWLFYLWHFRLCCHYCMISERL